MILFRCPACGTVHRADPQYAGGTMPCRNCGTQVPIPRQSDPACTLVYRAGESEDGTPMAVEDVRVKLVSGELSENDLIWDGQTWKPLGQAMGGVREGEGLRLKRREPSPAPSGGAESEDPLRDLSPIQKVDIADVEPRSKTRLFGRHREREQAPSADAGGAAKPSPIPEAGIAPPQEVATEKPKKVRRPRGRLYYAAQAAMGILAVVLGFRFGIGPLISSYRGTPSYVVVLNHEAVQYDAKLGWRGLKEQLFPNSLANFEIFVGLPERHTLRLVPTSPGQGEPYKVSVPLRPGRVTVVNLKGKGELGIYDMAAVRGRKLDTPELKALGNEIGANRAPDSAIKVSRQIRDLAAAAFRGVATDPIIQSIQYDVDEAMLYRLRERQANQAKKGDAKAKPKEDAKQPPKPLLTYPAVRTVAFGNGTALHTLNETDRYERTVQLPMSAVNLTASRVLKVSPPRLTITGDHKAVQLAIQVQNQEIKAENKTFTGTWEYRASAALEGASRYNWSWNWTYKGTGTANKKRFNIEIRVDQNGRETAKVTAV